MDGHFETPRGKRIRRRFEQSRLEPQMTALAYSVVWPLSRLWLTPADGGTGLQPEAAAPAENPARRQAAGA